MKLNKPSTGESDLYNNNKKSFSKFSVFFFNNSLKKIGQYFLSCGVVVFPSGIQVAVATGDFLWFYCWSLLPGLILYRYLNLVAQSCNMIKYKTSVIIKQ